MYNYSFGYKNRFEGRNDIKARGLYRVLLDLHNEGILNNAPINVHVEEDKDEDMTHFVIELEDKEEKE